MKLVPTPTLRVSVLTQKEITKSVNEELKSKCWTNKCTEILVSNPLILFEFDRLRHIFGVNELDVFFLNPWMSFCPCCNKTVKLKSPNGVEDFALHLSGHNSGESSRLEELIVKYKNGDHFFYDPDMPQFEFTSNRYDASHLSEAANLYMITRDIHPSNNYLTHWLAKLMSTKHIITPDTLIFQEMDALTSQVLSFPNTVKDWSKWPAVLEYNMCLASCTSEHVHKLFTGGHHTPMARKNEERNKSDENLLSSVQQFASTLNHSGPSYRTVLRAIGPIKLEPTPHQDNLYLHTCALERNKERAIYVEGYLTTRYPVSVVFDEQLLNPGVFLFQKRVPGNTQPEIFIGGLDSTVKLTDIQGEGLQVFLDKVGKEIHFLKSVSEFQCLDFANIFNSNALTKFGSTAISETYVEVIGNLQSCLKEVNVCQNCRINGYEECYFEDMAEQCQYCYQQERKCVSMVVMHAFCDMAAPQRKAAGLYPSLYSSDSNPQDVSKITVGFGQLHNLKAIQCSSRNWILSNGSNNHTLKVVASVYYRDDAIGNDLKGKLPSSVIIGRDKQSDELSYRLASPVVQKALTKSGSYQFSIIPERIFEFKTAGQSHSSLKKVHSIALDQFGNLVLSATYEEESNSIVDGIVCGDRSSVCNLVFTQCTLVSNLKVVGAVKRGSKRINIDTEDHEIETEGNSSTLFFGIDVDNHTLARLEVNKLRKVTLKHVHGIPEVFSFDLDVTNCRLAALHKECVTVFQYSPDNYGDFIPKQSISMPVQGNLEPHQRIQLAADSGILSFGGQSVNFHGLGVPLRRIGEFSTTVTALTYQSNIIFLAVENEPVLRKYVLENGQMELVEQIEIESKHKNDTVVAIVFDNEVLVLALNGILGSSIIQCGSTATSVEFLAAIEKGYNAIGYISRVMSVQEKSRIKKMNHIEALKNLQDCSKFFTNFLDSWRSKVGSYKQGNGSLVKPTIDCLSATVTSVELTIQRLNLLKAQNMEKLFLYTLTNECIVERSFGFISIKGGYFNKNIMEYCIAKRKTVIDMVCRNTATSFHTPSMNRKIYQTPILSSVNAREVFRDMRLINDRTVHTSLLQKTGRDGFQILKSVRNILGKQPAKTNRFRWKKDPGYEPTLLNQRHSAFVKGDLVPFSATGTGEWCLLKVEKDVSEVEFSKTDSISGLLMQKVDTEGMRYVPTESLINVHMNQMLRIYSDEVYIIPGEIAKKGRRPNNYWLLPEDTVTLLEEAMFSVGIRAVHDIDITTPEVARQDPDVEAPILTLAIKDYVVADDDGCTYIARVEQLTESTIVLKYMRKQTLIVDTRIQFMFPFEDDILPFTIRQGCYPESLLAKLLPTCYNVPRRGTDSSILVERDVVETFRIEETKK